MSAILSETQILPSKILSGLSLSRTEHGSSFKTQSSEQNQPTKRFKDNNCMLSYF